jgi:hypothetical protein
LVRAIGERSISSSSSSQRKNVRKALAGEHPPLPGRVDVQVTHGVIVTSRCHSKSPKRGTWRRLCAIVPWPEMISGPRRQAGQRPSAEAEGFQPRTLLRSLAFKLQWIRCKSDACRGHVFGSVQPRMVSLRRVAVVVAVVHASHPWLGGHRQARRYVTGTAVVGIQGQVVG